MLCGAVQVQVPSFLHFFYFLLLLPHLPLLTSIPLPPSSFPPSPTFLPLSLHFCCSLSLLPGILHSTIPKMPLCVCVSLSRPLSALSLFRPFLPRSFLYCPFHSSLFFSRPFVSFSLLPPSLPLISLSLCRTSLSCTSFVISLSPSHFSLDLSLSLPHLEFYVPQFQDTASSSVSSFPHSVSMYAHP